MRKFIVASMVLAGVVGVGSQASAQVAQWNVQPHGSPVDLSLSASNSDVNLAAVPALTRVGPGIAPSAAANSFSDLSNNITATLNTNADYITFTVAPAAGFQLNLTSLTWVMCGSNTAPGNGAWGFSSDGGATWSVDQFAMTLARNTNTFNFAVNTTGSVEFRFWSWGTVSVNGGTAAKGGTIRIAQDQANNNPELVLAGSVTAVPEPSTLSMIGFGIVGMLAFSRRRFSRN